MMTHPSPDNATFSTIYNKVKIMIFQMSGLDFETFPKFPILKF